MKMMLGLNMSLQIVIHCKRKVLNHMVEKSYNAMAGEPKL